MVNKGRPHTLKKSSEFKLLQRKGRRLSPEPWLLLNYSSNNQGVLRCGWTIPKKCGSAVFRNQLKRWCREYFRKKALDRESEERGWDVNVVFRLSERIRHIDLITALDKAWHKIDGAK